MRSNDESTPSMPTAPSPSPHRLILCIRHHRRLHGLARPSLATLPSHGCLAAVGDLHYLRGGSTPTDKVRLCVKYQCLLPPHSPSIVTTARTASAPLSPRACNLHPAPSLPSSPPHHRLRIDSPRLPYCQIAIADIATCSALPTCFHHPFCLGCPPALTPSR